MVPEIVSRIINRPAGDRGRAWAWPLGGRTLIKGLQPIVRGHAGRAQKPRFVVLLQKNGNGARGRFLDSFHPPDETPYLAALRKKACIKRPGGSG